MTTDEPDEDTPEGHQRMRQRIREALTPTPQPTPDPASAASSASSASAASAASAAWGVSARPSGTRRRIAASPHAAAGPARDGQPPAASPSTDPAAHQPTPPATTPAVAVLDSHQDDLALYRPAAAADIPPGADLGALGFLGPRLAGLGAWGHLLHQTHPDTHGPPPATVLGTALAQILGIHTPHPDITHSGMTHSGMTHSGMTHSGVTQPGVAQAGVAQAGVTRHGGLARLVGADPYLWTPLHVGRHGVAVGMGTDHGATLPLDFTAAPGLAVDGPAAAEVLRAMLLTILAGPVDQPPGHVLITRADAHTLLGATPSPHPAGLRIVPTLADALTCLTDTIQRRLTTNTTADTPAVTTAVTAVTAAEQPLTVLLCLEAPRAHHLACLAALLSQGTRSGVSALILGQGCPATPTITTTRGGLVSAAHGDTISYLRHARLYNLPATHAVELCTLIAHTQHSDPPPDPASTQD